MRRPAPVDMKPLETRKRLLLAESDLLRVQVSEDVRRLVEAWRHGRPEARPPAGKITLGGLLLAWLATRWRAARTPPQGPGRGAAIEGWLRGLGWISTLWLAWWRARSASP